VSLLFVSKSIPALLAEDGQALARNGNLSTLRKQGKTFKIPDLRGGLRFLTFVSFALQMFGILSFCEDSRLTRRVTNRIR